MEARISLTNHVNPIIEPLNKLALSSDNQPEVLFGDTFKRVKNLFDEKILLSANKVIDSDRSFFADPKNNTSDTFMQR